MYKHSKASKTRDIRLQYKVSLYEVLIEPLKQPGLKGEAGEKEIPRDKLIFIMLLSPLEHIVIHRAEAEGWEYKQTHVSKKQKNQQDCDTLKELYGKLRFQGLQGSQHWKDQDPRERCREVKLLVS